MAALGAARIGVVATAVGIVGAWAFVAAAAPEATDVALHLARAIRFETISFEDPAAFRGEPFEALFDELERMYPRTHARLSLERVGGYTLVFEWPGRDAALEPALFMSHTDVVPVEPDARSTWTHPPFAGTIADGRVWGRGAIDVKVGVILWLEAVEALLAEGFVPERTLYLVFGHDEETGGAQGALQVARRMAERGTRLAFVFDEGGGIFEGHPLLPDRTVASVVTAEKAYYTVELTAPGRSGHSSMPPRSTAIGRLARAIHRVEEHPMPARLCEPMRELLTAVAPYQPFGRRLAFSHLGLAGGLVEQGMLADPVGASLVRTTVAATLVSGGVKQNVLPESARATLNVRLLPGDTPEDVLAHLERVIDDPEIAIEGRNWGVPPRAASVSGEGYRLAVDAVHAVYPDMPVLPGLVPGATDSRHFAEVAREIYRFVPSRIPIEDASGAHGRDERIAVEGLGDSAAIAIGLMRRAGSRPALVADEARGS